MNSKFWKNRKVLVTGHTGFKGSWLSLWLISMGAKVYGLSLEPKQSPNLFTTLNLESDLEHKTCDLRNSINITAIIQECKPEIVFHLAAQALVFDAYKDPIITYETNVIGTLNLLQAARNVGTVRAIVNITTDKCYHNFEWERGYLETDRLGGYDPYSSSKACVEILSDSFRKSYLSKEGIHLATARSGNVIGGGDWSENRLVPDILKSIENNHPAQIRNPLAIRPWQHVLEPLSGYLILAENLTEDGHNFSEAWNFGPNESDTKSVAWIADHMINIWGNSARWVSTQTSEKLHEANYLKLDISKARSRLNWHPKWSLKIALKKTIEWHQSWLKGTDVQLLCLQQMQDFESSR